MASGLKFCAAFSQALKTSAGSAFPLCASEMLHSAAIAQHDIKAVAAAAAAVNLIFISPSGISNPQSS